MVVCGRIPAMIAPMNTRACPDCGALLRPLRGHWLPEKVGPNMKCQRCSEAWTVYCALVEDR